MRWSMPQGRWRSVVVALGLLLIASRAGAQTAELRGVVTDTSNAVLPGVNVTIKGTETGAERSLVTDSTGSFRGPGLAPGPYRVTSELMGFKTNVKAVTLTVGQVAELRIALEVGTVSETVEVKGTSETIDTTKSDLSAVVTTQQLDALPVLNRGFIGLAQLLPGGGPARTADARFGIQTAFGGTNVRSMYSTLIDGSNMDHPVYGFSIVNVNQDAVQEFRVLRNQYDAQYSRAGTAVVNVLTRSGTNLFHGSGSYFGRDDSLNAKNYFATAKPPFNLTRLSGTFGGPIEQNKIHFFVAGEYLRTNSVTLIALNKTNPFASTWNGSYPSGDREKTLQAKVNFQPNEKHSAWVRYALDLLKQDYTYVHAQNYDNQVNDVAGSWNWIMSGSRLNTVTVQYLDQYTNRFDKSTEAQVIRPSFTSGRATNLPQAFPRVHIALNETFFVAPRRHALKLGFSVAHETLDYLADWYGGGSWTFDTDRPFDQNDPTTWPKLYVVGSGPSTQRYKNFEWGFFVQDDWKPLDRLTVNMGLRYDFDSNLRSNDFIASLLADPQFAGLGNMVKAPRGNDYSQIQPRVGIAWDATGDGRTVVRAGFGIYAARNRPWFNVRGQVLAGQYTAEVSDPNLLKFYPDQTAVLGGKTIQDYIKTAGGRAMYLPGDNLMIPKVYNYTIGIAKTLFKTTTLEVDFIHSNQVDLQTGRDGNIDPTKVKPFVRPYPQFSTVTLIEPLTDSMYNALQTQLNSRLSWGTYRVSYTYGKMRSEGTNDNANVSTDPLHLLGNDDRGLDENDRRHALSASAILDLPWRIQLSAIISLRTGNPWEVNAGVDLDGYTADRTERPSGLVKSAGGTESETNLAIINAFRATRKLAPITMEQLTRGSGDKLLDLRLTKSIGLGGAKRADLFIEAYNLTNAVNYENPTGAITSASFAIYTVAKDARQIQWGVKFIF